MLGAIALACGTVPLVGAAPAYAESATEPGSVGAYYYSAGIDKPDAAPAPPPNVTAMGTDFVAEGHLPVAVRVPGETDKMSFLAFDLDTVPLDATITTAVVTLPLAEDTAASDPRTANDQRSPAPQKVRACAAGPEGFNGEDGQSFAQAPTFDCEAFSAIAKESADKKSYVFDVSALAATWLTGSNNGIALVPADGADASEFQVVFLPANKASITVGFTLPPEEIEVVPPTVTVPEPAPFTGGTGTTDFGGFTGGTDVAVPPTLPEAVPQPQAMPVPTAAVAQSPATTPVAQVRAIESLTPTSMFWVLGLALAGLLALLSRIMGDSEVAVASAGSSSRLSRALKAQRGTSGARVSGLGAPRPLSI